MKTLTMVGVVLLLLGVLSFVVPVPQREEHSLKIGDAKLGVQTQTNQKIPIGASIAIVAAGTACLIFGSRKS